MILKSETGSFECSVVRTGNITSKPIDDDPRCVIQSLQMDLIGLENPLAGSTAEYGDNYWYVWETDGWLDRSLISVEFRRAKLVDCCTGTIKWLERDEGCEEEDEVFLTKEVKMVASHLESKTVRVGDSEIPVDFFEFKLECAPILTTRNVIEWDHKTYKVSSVENAGNPMELTIIKAQVSPLSRGVLG